MNTAVLRRIESAFSRKQSNRCLKPGTASRWVCASLRLLTSTICRTTTHSTPSPSRLRRLNDYGLGYLHVVEKAQDSKGSSEEALALSAHLRTLWKGLYVVNGGYDGPRGEEAIRTGHADAVAYGRAFLANPDLPRRLQLGAALNEPDPTTFYGGGAAGYTSYPALTLGGQ